MQKRNNKQWLFPLLFAISCLLFWSLVYPNHLMQREQMQMFLLSAPYFLKLISFQGGLAIYSGEFLVQFFCVGWAGPVIVSMLLTSLILVTQKILIKINPTGNFLFLSYLPAIGYWILLTNNFFYVSGAVGLLFSLLSIWFYVSFEKHITRVWVAIFIIPVLYWFSGGAFLVTVSGMILFEIIRNFRSGIISKTIIVTTVLAYAIAAMIIPLVARHVFLLDTLLQTFLSEAYYQIRIFFPAGLKLVFLSIPAAILLHGFVYTGLNKQKEALIQAISTGFLIILTGYGLIYSTNMSRERELMFDNLVFRQNWEKIIKEAERKAPQGAVSKIAVNLALLNTGQLTEKLFMFKPLPSDLFLHYERRGLNPLISNEPYFYLGLINFSQMLAVESYESTIDAKKPVRAVKRIAETYLITGQYQVAEKFLNYLSKTLFYKTWAQNALDHLYHDNRIQAHPIWGRLRHNQPKEDFYYNGSRMDIALMYLLRSNLHNKAAYEYLMASFLLKKDLDAIINYMPLLQPLNYSNTPISLQEALVYIETLMPRIPQHLKDIPINPSTRQNLQKYAAAFQKDGDNRAQTMKKEFGKTYWYYIHFR